MNNQMKPLFLSAALAMAIATGMAITSGQDQEQSFPKKGTDATPIQEGVMTERQRQHSKLYDKTLRSRRAITAAPSGIDFKITTPWGEAPNEGPSTSTKEFLQTSTCSADAVVIGLVKNKTSLLTEDGRFVFTDYDMQVEEVIKNNQNGLIRPDSTLIVTRPGGVVEVNGKVFRVTDDSFRPLEINGRYLLLLQFIPSTGAYRAVNGHSSFELSQNRVTRLTKQPLPYSFRYEDDAAAFAAQARLAASNCAEK